MNNISQPTNKGANKLSKGVTKTQQQRPTESPEITLTWHANKYKVHKLRATRATASDIFVCFNNILIFGSDGENKKGHCLDGNLTVKRFITQHFSQALYRDSS